MTLVLSSPHFSEIPSFCRFALLEISSITTFGVGLFVFNMCNSLPGKTITKETRVVDVCFHEHESIEALERKVTALHQRMMAGSKEQSQVLTVINPERTMRRSTTSRSLFPKSAADSSLSSRRAVLHGRRKSDVPALRTPPSQSMANKRQWSSFSTLSSDSATSSLSCARRERFFASDNNSRLLRQQMIHML